MLRLMLRGAIALGGAAGAIARYGCGLIAGGAAAGFPWGTLVVNVSGCWLLGFLLRVLPHPSAGLPRLNAGLTVGFCGGFTTFSTFAFEALLLARAGQTGLASIYVAITLIVGVLATSAGIGTGSLLEGRRTALARTVVRARGSKASAPDAPPQDGA